MADQADKPAKSTKRRVVRNPETFRERAIKANADDGKPRRFSQLKSGGAKVATPVARPVGRGFKAVFNRKPFTLLRRPLRIVGKVLLPSFVRNSWKELRLVTWPSWAESRRLTFAVLVFAIIFGASVALLDYGLDKIFRNILLK